MIKKWNLISKLDLCVEKDIVGYVAMWWLDGQYFFFLREFQPMASTPDDSSLSSDQLSSDQDTNQFLV